MLYDLIACNLSTYLLSGLMLPMVLVLFWYLWCRERIILLGIIASVVLTVLYALAGSILLYRFGDPTMLSACGSVGLIDRKAALRDYLRSSFFRLDNDRSWNVLPAIDPEWESHAELMNREALADYLAQSLNTVQGQRASSVLDRIDPGWRDGELGARVGRGLIGKLSNLANLTKEDRKQLAFLQSLGNFSGYPEINTQITSLLSPRTGRAWELYLPGEMILSMVWIGPGSFKMGSPRSESGWNDDETEHDVRLTKGYWLGKYEITQAQWVALMGNNPSHFKNVGKDAPVESVSWKDVMNFCRKLTEMERDGGHLPEGYEYSLPTEAQWEYACRAGTRTLFCTGGSVDQTGWFYSNSGKTTHPVGKKMTNAWGLYDMHGNVSEWCFDRYGSYPSGSVTDPVGVYRNANHVIRGGYHTSLYEDLRSASRSHASEDSHDIGRGFRLALRSVN